MGYLIKDGVQFFGNNSVSLTQAQYDALVAAGTVDPTAVYYITDRSQACGAYASGVAYDNTDSQLDATNVQNAIDEVVTNVQDTADEVATVKSSIGHIDDVSITSPSTGDMLSWDGSAWANLAMATIIDKIYPVGSIYISVTDSTVAQVESRFGGTWQAFGAGRTLVGVDPNDTSFDTVEETGGEKSHSYTPAGSNSGGSVGNTTLTAAQSGVPQHTHSVTTTANNTGAGNKLAYRLVWGAGDGHANNHVNGWNGGPGYSDFNDQAWPLQTHTHSIPALSGTAAKNTAANASQAHNHGFTNPTFTGTAATMSHMQPYITTYMYKRIA